MIRVSRSRWLWLALWCALVAGAAVLCVAAIVGVGD